MITEQHLYLALESFNNSEEGSKLNDLALNSILLYCLQTLTEQGLEATDDVVTDMAQKLAIDHAIDNLIGAGFIDCHWTEQGEILELTEIGKLAAEGLDG